MAKIAVLGGSGIATPELVAALARRADEGIDCEIALIARSADKLDRVAHLCRSIAEGRPGLRVTHTTDAKAGLDGADYVLNQVRVGGVEARAFDETFPLEFGLPGEETVGPGGFANALRTIPTVLESARLVEQVAPHALFANFTNPTSFVQYAVSRYTSLSTLGLCDSPVSLIAGVAEALGVPAAELSVEYVGMHHFGFVVAAYHDGRDILPRAIDNAAAIVGLGTAPEAVQALGVVPHPYFRYYVHSDEIVASQQGKEPRARQLGNLQREILSAYEGPTESALAALARRGARWYELIVAPVLHALLTRRTATHIVNVVNGGVLPWLPAAAVIETPALLQQGTVHPLAPHRVPDTVRALVTANCLYEMAAVDAIVERSRRRAMEALLIHPMRLTLQQARGILDRVWPDGGGCR